MPRSYRHGKGLDRVTIGLPLWLGAALDELQKEMAFNSRPHLILEVLADFVQRCGYKPPTEDSEPLDSLVERARRKKRR